MKKFTLFTILNFVLIVAVSAQQSAFTIILNKGANTHCVEGKAKNPVILGETLQSNEQIALEEGGYMALVHDQTGISLELKESGEYFVSDLLNKVDQESNSVMSKYGKYLMSKLNPEGTGNQNLNVTGAVERGDEDFIKVYLPMVTDVYGEDMLIAWQQADDVQDYVITIKDGRDEIIARKNVKGTKFRLSFNEQPFTDKKLMIVNIRSRFNEDFVSKDYGINRISEEQKLNIQTEYESLIGEANSDNVINKLLIASFFEENELLGDAISYYDQALALSPDTDGFGKLYNNFLYRNRLK